MRILHLPRNVGGHAAGLVEAERALGFQAHLIEFGGSNFYSPSFEVVDIDRAGFFWGEVIRWYVLLTNVLRYDVFHFNFGEKFLHFPISWWKPGEGISRRFFRFAFAVYSRCFGTFDLWLLKGLRKKIVVTFQGDDIRQGDFARQKFDIHFVTDVRPGYYDATSDRRKRKMIASWDRYADQIFALNPDLLHVLPERAELLSYAHVNPSNFDGIKDEVGTPTLRIVHAPSDRQVKGTNYLIAAVQKMKTAGFDLELILVEGQRFEDALKVYKSADLVVDQLLAGWYGGFAVEAMALRKPVIAYLREEDLKFIPLEMVESLPIIRANKNDIEMVLRRVFLERDRLHWIGLQSRKFVEHWHDPKLVAQRTVKSYLATPDRRY